MRKNVFIKSILRQHMRTILLLLLTAVAAFMFVMRTVEYIVVTGQIETIGSYYRSIGFLQVTEGTDALENVFAGAEIVRSSPYTAIEDKRRDVAGYLQGLTNVDIRGIDKTAEEQFRQHDAFFYGEILSIELIPFYIPPHMPQIRLIVRVDSVLAGYPEHVTVGQEITIRYILEGDEKDLCNSLPPLDPATPELVRQNTPLKDMQVGERYLLRGVLYENIIHTIFLGNPEEGRNTDADILNMRPLNEDTSDNARTLDGDGVWYIHAPTGDSGNLSAPGLEGLNEELERNRRSLSEVTLRTTKDMTAMPITQPPRDLLHLVRGRWINLEDNANSNPEAMIHEQFAEYRGLEIGDTITVNVPQRKTVLGAQHLQDVASLIVSGAPEYEPEYTLELEIVGIFTYPGQVITTGGELSGIMQFTLYTEVTNIVYIPDSILPEVDFQINNPAFEDLGWTGSSDYLPEFLYSFVLDDSRNQAAFLLETRDAFAKLGMSVQFLETGANDFWTTAGPILQDVAFNTVIFSVVFVFVLVLVVFLYLRQRRRDFAIMRALGVPAKEAFRQLLISIFVLGLPAMLIGGSAAWYFALGQVAKILNPFGKVVTAFEYDLDILLSMLWLPALIAVGICVLLVITVGGTALTSRRPVLEILQGTGSAGKNKVRTASCECASRYLQQRRCAAPGGGNQAPSRIGLARARRYRIRFKR